MALSSIPASRVLARDGVNTLIRRLGQDRRTVLGPVVRDGAIIYGEITCDTDFPVGWGDVQEAGRYRLAPRGDEALFGYAVGPDSLKRHLRPPYRRLWSARRSNGDLRFETETDREPARYAFIGVRACELAALAVSDRVLLQEPYADRGYASLRQDALIIAVNCSTCAATCFCTSMGTGPKAKAGFDLALTELLDEDGHRFLIEAGTDVGAAILDDLPTRAAGPDDFKAASAASRRVQTAMTRKLETKGLPERLAAAPEHPRWAEVAERCLACGNCTQVCPTCFCTTVEDHTDLTGETAERVQVWDSCFTGRFAELSGGQVRETTSARYRQWLTHKLSTWVDQFGTSGCVGCGRCIAWCPVGIDLTEEAAAIAFDAEVGP